MQGLTSGQREVAAAISLEGKSIAEAVDSLKMKENAVRVALHRGPHSEVGWMKTDDPIRAITADAGKPPISMHVVRPAALRGAIVVAALDFSVIEPRPDFVRAAETVRFLFKFVVMSALVVSAFPVLRSVAQPGARPPFWGTGRCTRTDPLGDRAGTRCPAAGQRLSALVGTNAFYCMKLIPLLDFGPLVLMLAASKHGAPPSPF